MPDAAPVVIRRARIEDVEPIVRLWREMWEYHAPLDPRFEISPAADLVMGKWIEESLQSPRAALFVAEQAPGALEGYCHALILENPPVVPHLQDGYVSELAVHRRRKRIGTQLLQARQDAGRLRLERAAERHRLDLVPARAGNERGLEEARLRGELTGDAREGCGHEGLRL